MAAQWMLVAFVVAPTYANLILSQSLLVAAEEQILGMPQLERPVVLRKEVVRLQETMDTAKIQDWAGLQLRVQPPALCSRQLYGRVQCWDYLWQHGHGLQLKYN